MAGIHEREGIVELLKTYESLPALWDVKHEDYTNRVIKNKQYDILLEKFKETNPSGYMKELKRKINALRTNYRRERKRLKDAEKNGRKEKPTLYYYNDLKFLNSIKDASACKEVQDLEVPEGEEKTICLNENLVHPTSENFKQSQVESQQLVSVWGQKLPKMNDALQEEENIIHINNNLVNLTSQNLKQSQDECPQLGGVGDKKLEKMDGEPKPREKVNCPKEDLVIFPAKHSKQLRSECQQLGSVCGQQFSQGDNEPEQKEKIICLNDDLMFLAAENFKQSQYVYEELCSVWVNKLSKLGKSQRIFAEKLINDILFHGELGLLHFSTTITNLSPYKSVSIIKEESIDF